MISEIPAVNALELIKANPQFQVTETPTQWDKATARAQISDTSGHLTVNWQDRGWQPSEQWLSAHTTRPTSSGHLVNLRLGVDNTGNVLKFLPVGLDDSTITVFKPIEASDSYYAVHYQIDPTNPFQANLREANLMYYVERDGYKTTEAERTISRKGVFNTAYSRFLQQTGLPERADLLRTLVMYIEGSFEDQTGQRIPLTPSQANALPVLPALS